MELFISSIFFLIKNFSKMIRPLTTNDVDEFIRVRKAALVNHPFSFGASPHRIIDKKQTAIDLANKNEENFILGYFDEAQLIGMVGFMRYNEKRIHKGIIWGMYVDKNYQGKGIGQKLMEMTIAKVKQIKGLTKINLSVTHLSKAAFHLYQKLGFTVYGREIAASYWNGIAMDEIFMDLMLDN